MAEEKISEIEFPELASEIISMSDEDQRMIGVYIETNKEIDKENFKAITKLHIKRIKEIIHEIGWPTIPKVGDQASHMAWLLVQHADHDPQFQEECLDKMKMSGEDEVKKVDIAYLVDRVRVNTGQPQIYGTQFHTDENGVYGPWRIENPEIVDKLRIELGLDPLSEYRKVLIERYKIKEK